MTGGEHVGARHRGSSRHRHHHRRAVTALAGVGLVALLASCATSAAQPSPTASGGPTHTPPGPSVTSGDPGSPTDSDRTLDLPRVPWEGGAAYYEQFPGSVGWSDPAHFPIGIWWAAAGPAADFAWDKAHGINVYVVNNADASQADFEAAGAQVISSGDGDGAQGVNGLKGWDAGSRAWAGGFLGDEVDGRFDPPSAGQAELSAQRDRQTARFGGKKLLYANFTGIVASSYNPAQLAADDAFVNLYDGPVSADVYWYSIRGCEQPDHRDWTFVPVTNAICHSSSSYGHTVDSVRARDASDGRLKPVWGFVELYGGVGDASNPASFLSITPEQVKGAVMMSLIHEARGIVYFNQSFYGPCVTGNIIRAAQAATAAGDPTGGCAGPTVAAAQQVDALVQSLAPVLNSQSYRWTFAPDVDTMLKTADGYAYVFAMTHEATTGQRTFTLPPGVTGTTAEVVGEGRSVTVAGGRFTDDFPTEATYHVYRIRL